MSINTFPSSTTKVLLVYAALLLLFYATSIPDEKLVAALSVASLIFLLDILWLQRITQGLPEKLNTTDCIHTALGSHFKRALPTDWLYSLLRQEIFVVFYAFFARNFSPKQCNNIDSFGYRNASNSRDVFWLVATTQLPTLPFIHLFIEQQGNTYAAWLVTALTLWSVLYFYAQKTAIQFLPVLLHKSHLEFRYGLSRRADIPLANIKSARLLNFSDKADYFEHFTSPFGSNKNLLLEFYEPVTFFGSYLNRKRRKKALIAVDEPNALLKSLTQKSGAVFLNH